MGKGKLVAILALPVICIAVGIYLLCLAGVYQMLRILLRKKK